MGEDQSDPFLGPPGWPAAPWRPSVFWADVGLGMHFSLQVWAILLVGAPCPQSPFGVAHHLLCARERGPSHAGRPALWGHITTPMDSWY